MKRASFSRRAALKLCAFAPLALTLPPSAAAGPGAVPRSAAPSSRILQRSIPRNGEQLPAIGLGTWQTSMSAPARTSAHR